MCEEQFAFSQFFVHSMMALFEGLVKEEAKGAIDLPCKQPVHCDECRL